MRFGVLIGLTIGLTLFISGPLFGEDSLEERCRAALDASTKLWQAGRADEAHAVLAPVLEEARAQGDRGSLLLILNTKGQMWASLGYARQAEKVLREAMEIAESLEDARNLCVSLRWLYVSCNILGRPDEANALCQRLLQLARAHGDRGHEAWGLAGIAWKHLQDNEAAAARQCYEEAIGIFRDLEDERAEIWLLNSLGLALDRLKAYGEARSCYSRCAELAAKVGMLSAEANALNNLGCMEYMFGDASKAEESFRRAYELHCADGSLAYAVNPATNIVLCLKDLGRYEEAGVMLEELLSTCREQGNSNLEISVLNRLAQLRGEEGKLNEAASIFRQVLSRNPAPKQEAEARIGLSTILTWMGESEEALDVLEKDAARLRPRLKPATAHLYDYTLNKRIQAAGRTEEALEKMLESSREAEKLGKAGFQMDALVRAARCCRILGRLDQALEHLQSAAQCWERERGLSADPERREHAGRWGQELFVRLTDLLLQYPPEKPEARRIADAFDTLQQYKSRTLQERMMGPAAFDPDNPALPVKPSITLNELQDGILRDGELLLETMTGEDHTILMAITRDDCRAVRLPGVLSPFGTKIDLYYELLAAPPASVDRAEIVEEAGRSLSRLLLDEIADLVQGARRIILVPDGILNLIPLSGLCLPDGERLLDGRDLMRVPSATILAESRSPSKEEEGPIRLLALAGEKDREGRPLAGALWEVEHLGRRYERIDQCSTDDIVSAQRLVDYDMLHLAGHVMLDDQYPWRSGILIGREGGGEGREYLCASEITPMRLQARMVVISGCGSACGRVLSGEGVLGLTSAFLSAGVPVVVASLWPVDDSTTARFMERFYDSLANGKTVASSLRSAQRGLMEDPRTAHPFFWAGFVVVGDGAVPVPLDRKTPWWLLGALGFICSLALLVPFLLRRR